MRKIVAGPFMSLDGVVEAPDNWTFPYFNGEVAQVVGAAMTAADTILLGGERTRTSPRTGLTRRPATTRFQITSTTPPRSSSQKP